MNPDSRALVHINQSLYERFRELFIQLRIAIVNAELKYQENIQRNSN